MGFGCSGRCAPACGLPRFLAPAPSSLPAAEAEGFCPLLGGVLELSGVFFGRSSLASSSATRRVKRSMISACDKIRRISVSRSSESSVARSIGSVNQTAIRLSIAQLNLSSRKGEQLRYFQRCVARYFVRLARYPDGIRDIPP